MFLVFVLSGSSFRSIYYLDPVNPVHPVKEGHQSITKIPLVTRPDLTSSIAL